MRLPISLPRLTRLPLALEITLALTIKIAILTLLWWMFFSAPQTKKMMLPTRQVEQHMLTSSRIDSHAPINFLSVEAQHGSHR
jgi:hypothetical protein